MGEDVIEEIIVKKGWEEKKSTSSEIEIEDSIGPIKYDSTLDNKFINKLIEEEMIMTLEDLVARRTRLLFLDTERTKSVLNTWGELLRIQLKKDEAWKNEQVKSVLRLIEDVYEPVTN